MTPHAPSSESLSLTDALTANQNPTQIIDVDEPTQAYVVFRLAGQRFALPGVDVSEILPGEHPVYFVPGLPASTEGVIHLRGAIESVIHWHRLLDVSPPDTQPHGSMLLLVTTSAMSSAVRVDQLDDVCDIPDSAIKPPPETLSATLRPYVHGLWQSEDDHSTAVAVLDALALFNAYQSGSG
ncbi:MAG: chemotaxis protein CheW [Pseudomonadota bacterium]